MGAARLIRIVTMVSAIALAAVACEKSGSKAPGADETKAVGSVSEIAGTVSAKRASKPAARQLAKGDAVFADDTITTSADSSVSVMLTHNNVLFSLAANKTRVLRESPAWTAKRQTRTALDKNVSDSTHLAGRHAEKSSAETAATANKPGTTAIRASDEDTDSNSTDGHLDRPVDSKRDKPKDGESKQGPDKRKPKVGDKRKPKGSKDKDPKGSKDKTPKGGGTDSTSNGKLPDPKKPGDTKCDEISCLVTKKPLPCCSKYKRKKIGGKIGKNDSALTEKLSRSQIQRGFKKVRSRIRACAPAGFKGMLRFKIKVAPNGRVATASISGTLEPKPRACMMAAAKSARFAKTQAGGSFTYPVLFK